MRLWVGFSQNSMKGLTEAEISISKNKRKHLIHDMMAALTMWGWTRWSFCFGNLNFDAGWFVFVTIASKKFTSESTSKISSLGDRGRRVKVADNFSVMHLTLISFEQHRCDTWVHRWTNCSLVYTKEWGLPNRAVSQAIRWGNGQQSKIWNSKGYLRKLSA